MTCADLSVSLDSGLELWLWSSALLKLAHGVHGALVRGWL